MRIIYLSLSLFLSNTFHQDAFSASPMDISEESETSMSMVEGNTLTINEEDNPDAVLNYFNTLKQNDPLFEDIENITIKSPDLKALPKTIGLFKNLKTLDIHDTDIYSLRDTINDDESIHLIDMLKNNEINIIKRKQPRAVKKALYYEQEGISPFESFIVDLERTHKKPEFSLQMSGDDNLLIDTKIYTNLRKLSHLSDLYLVYFYDDELPLDDIKRLKNLKKLSLETLRTPKGQEPKGQELLKEIAKIENLKSIEIKNYPVNFIPKEIFDMPNLEKLNFFDSLSGDISGMKNANSLKELDIRYNKLTSFDGRELQERQRTIDSHSVGDLFQLWRSPFADSKLQGRERTIDCYFLGNPFQSWRVNPKITLKLHGTADDRRWGGTPIHIHFDGNVFNELEDFNRLHDILQPNVECLGLDFNKKEVSLGIKFFENSQLSDFLKGYGINSNTVILRNPYGRRSIDIKNLSDGSKKDELIQILEKVRDGLPLTEPGHLTKAARK